MTMSTRRLLLLAFVLLSLVGQVSAQTNTNVQRVGGVAVNTGAGNVATGTIRVVLGTDQLPVAGNITQVAGATMSATNPLWVRFTDGAAAVTPSTLVTHDTTLGTVTSVTGAASMCRSSAAAPTDVSADGEGALFWCLRSGALAFQPTFAGALAAAGAGNVGATVQRVDVANDGQVATDVAAIKTAVQLIDNAQTGDSIHYRTSAGSTEDEHEVKATAGVLYSIAITNTNAAVRYWRCSNLTAANTTPGTSTVLLGLAIPGATTGAGFTHTFGPNGAAFSTALTCWLVTGAADTDVAEVAANEIKVTYTFK